MPSLRLLIVAATLLVTGSSLSAAPGGSNSGKDGGKSGNKPSACEPGPRVVEPADRRAFYRDGWRALLGRRVHLHVEAEVLRRVPEKFAGADRRTRWRFANRSVALVVDPGSPEWRKAMEDREDASEFCLHGIVRLAPAGTRALAQLDVDSVKRAPGSRRRSGR
jgi:hypothetical protein